MVHAIAAKAVGFHEAMQPEFTEYQRATINNAITLGIELQKLGLRLITGGTDNHLVLVDLTGIGVTGRKAERALGGVGIVVNRNSIPFDTRSATVTSGIRLGTPAVTTRGFGKEEMISIASLLVKTISNIDNDEVKDEVKKQVDEMCSRFPIQGIIVVIV